MLANAFCSFGSISNELRWCVLAITTYLGIQSVDASKFFRDDAVGKWNLCVERRVVALAQACKVKRSS
jgi:hypothetical protein